MANRNQKSSRTSQSTNSRSSRNGNRKSATTVRRSARKESSPSFHLPGIDFSATAGLFRHDSIKSIFGIILCLTAIFCWISLLSLDRQKLDSPILQSLFSLLGLGIYLAPLILLVCGLWLLFRHLDILPRFNGERMAGILILFINLETIIHWFTDGGWNQMDASAGGGYLGAFFALNIISALGKPASMVFLLAWFLIGLDILLDRSTYDLSRLVLRPLKPLKNQFLKEWRQWRLDLHRKFNSSLPGTESIQTKQGEGENLSDFHPLPKRRKARSNNSNLQTTETQSEESDVLPETLPPAQTNWTLPTIEAILDPADPVSKSGLEQNDRSKLIEETLTSFGAPGHVVEVHSGPTVTMYGVEPDLIETRSGKMRVRVSKISSLADDLALALAAPRIRIQAPVPGRNFVGIEVPNQETNRVTLRELLESPEFDRVHSPLRFALGKDVSGNPIIADLRNMPHLLVAGTTGSGKSVCINTILCSFLLNNSPVDLRLILIDPKRVELSGYNRIPQLLAPVIVDAERVVGALQWVLREMDNRYHKFTRVGVRNIQDFNNLQPEGEYLPHLVVVIDELADLMMLAPDETEKAITRLAQLARATGIHMIIATQRPSVDVVTGLIKANFPARIAFAVASSVDSRVIIDQPGAERLLGRGDMLFLPPDSPAPIRLQGAYVSDSEIQLLVDYWKYNAADTSQESTNSMPSNIDTLPPTVPLHQIPLWEEKTVDKGDALLPKAIEIAKNEKRASITMLQRKLRIGYTRAARLIDTLEEQGLISPAQGASQLREYIGPQDEAQTDSPSIEE